MYFIEAAFWRLVGLPYVAEGEVERFQHPPVHIGLFGQRSALAVSPHASVTGHPAPPHDTRQCICFPTAPLPSGGTEKNSVHLHTRIPGHEDF